MISVVIPVRNGGEGLARCLDAIAAQEFDSAVEVLVVDSGSTDGSQDLARARGTRVHEVPATDFNHGGTRNLGARLARGDVIVFTVDDARPMGERWLADLVEPLERDASPAPTRARSPTTTRRRTSATTSTTGLDPIRGSSRQATRRS